MHFRPAFALLALLSIVSNNFLVAQNINTTFRSKISFPGQTLANIWGYEYRGTEYALVGGSNGMIIVDITNPDAPQQIVQLPAPEGPPNDGSLWKEIKTFHHYAYMVTEAGGGIQIIDLSKLPSANLDYHNYTGDGPIAGQLNKIHALHIDETKGYLYAWGGNLFGGAAKIFDLNQDPYNPVYVGKYDQLGYIHDGYVDNDTMYSGHIYAGQFAIVNMANKSAAELINTQTTPNAFTHNTWLADDRRTLLTTDERSNSYLAAYDVSDPTDIKFLDKMQGIPGSGSIVHNTYALRNWAVSSWYKDGFNMVDITRPDNLIQVGNFDTYPNGSGDGFVGCWGVYPFFPSGTLIASNIGAPGELWVVTPNYVRACYLEGKITDAVTGAALQNADIQVLGSSPALQEKSAFNGLYKTGQEAEGYYQVRVSKSGYQDFETSVYFQRGEVIVLDVPLYPTGQINITGTVLNHQDGLPVENASVWLYGAFNPSPVLTDAAGKFSFENVPPGKYDLAASATDLGFGMLNGQKITASTDLLLELFTTHRRDAVLPWAQSGKPGAAQFELIQKPFENEIQLNYYQLQGNCTLSLYNSVGQLLENKTLSNSEGSIALGLDLPKGVYFVALKQNETVLEVKRLVK